MNGNWDLDFFGSAGCRFAGCGYRVKKEGGQEPVLHEGRGRSKWSGGWFRKTRSKPVIVARKSKEENKVG